MDSIILRCKSCQHTMKFSAEKAGKKSKCSKCGTVFVIQADEPEEQAPAPEVAAAPEEKPAPVDEFANDGPAEYGVFVDPELAEMEKKRQEEEEAAKKKKKDKKNLPTVTRKIKAIPEAASWDKVRLGLLCWFVGTCFWLVAHLLHGSYLVLGSTELPEFAVLMGDKVARRVGDDLPPRGQFWNIDEMDIYMGMIAGRDYAGYAKVCLTIATLLHFLQALAWGAGYLLCLPVPRRRGMFGQVLLLLGLLAFNGLVMLFFKLLPVLGAINYFMIPFVVPEIAMTEYNMERSIPINVLFSGAPFWENFLCVLFKFAQYLEPAMACVFVWSAGLVIKDEEVADAGKGMAEMILGTFFVILGYHLLCICGASPVLVRVLRVFYVLWYFFLLLFQLQYAMMLLKVREVLEAKIRPKNELVPDEEEDEKPKSKKGSKKKSKSRALLGETASTIPETRWPGCRSP